ncbi:MAG: peroxidase-related enzyme [Saprospiraceae bacterium]
MPHIPLPDHIAGIRSLVIQYPESGKYLYELVQILLRGESPLSPAERELIAAFVSYLNECSFCYNSHAAASRYLFQDQSGIVDLVLKDYASAPISDKLKALLTIASRVQVDARTVSEQDIALARSFGANDRDIHDTVLIAATFCMFNRYVDGLATTVPENLEDYIPMGERMATKGYVHPIPQ